MVQTYVDSVDKRRVCFPSRDGYVLSRHLDEINVPYNCSVVEDNGSKVVSFNLTGFRRDVIFRKLEKELEAFRIRDVLFKGEDEVGVCGEYDGFHWNYAPGSLGKVVTIKFGGKDNYTEKIVFD